MWNNLPGELLNSHFYDVNGMRTTKYLDDVFSVFFLELLPQDEEQLAVKLNSDPSETIHYFTRCTKSAFVVAFIFSVRDVEVKV